MGIFLGWPKSLQKSDDSTDLDNRPFARTGKNNANLNNFSNDSLRDEHLDNSPSEASAVNSVVQEVLVKQECGQFRHWSNIEELKKELQKVLQNDVQKGVQKDKSLQLVWATWHGIADGKKISWQFYLRPPAFAIVDSLFFISDSNDVPMKQDKIPQPFTDPIGQLIFDRIQILESSYPDSHWQFALNFTENQNHVTSMIWEENEGFTTCEINQTP